MSECIATTVLASLISALIGVVIGAFIGHWFAVNRDKRKEINDVMDRVRATFEKQANAPSLYREVLTDDVALLRHHMTRRERKKYDECIERYKQANIGGNVFTNPGHEVEYMSPEKASDAALDVVRLLRRR